MQVLKPNKNIFNLLKLKTERHFNWQIKSNVPFGLTFRRLIAPKKRNQDLSKS